MNTSSIRSGESLARSTAAVITWEPSLWALKGDRSPMNFPSGVRAAETMTTGSEAVAMTDAPQCYARQSVFDYGHHMMHCEICNGGPGINCREVGRPRPVRCGSNSRHHPDNPANAAVSILTNVTAYWMPRRSLSSSGASADPLARHDGV